MHVKTFLGRKTAAIAVLALVAIGLAACAPPPAGSSGPSDAFASQLYSALNADRTGAGLPALAWNSQLGANANAWAATMMQANTLYHQNLSALLYSPAYASFRTLGENILVGPGSMTASAIEAAWKASPPHWANITNPAFNVVGIGYARGPDGRIWAVQEFGGL